MFHHGEYRQWPLLTQEEFNLACAFLDQRYVKARLGPTRRTLKIRLRRDLSTGAVNIEILRLLHLIEDADDLSLGFESLKTGEEQSQEPVMDTEMAMEEADEEALHPDQVDGSNNEIPPQCSLYSHQPYVTYEIHLHPTYRVPTLWFTLHDLPMNEAAFDLDSVYRYLVPTEYKSRVRAAGPLGGISAAPHPLTDIPAFFIHPCQTKEAMEDLECPLTDYLMVWLGIVGGCVGLWIPPEMAQEEVRSQ